eukprot:3095356-Pleurochrysis_carterae.AAC.5
MRSWPAAAHESCEVGCKCPKTMRSDCARKRKQRVSGEQGEDERKSAPPSAKGDGRVTARADPSAESW